LYVPYIDTSKEKKLWIRNRVARFFLVQHAGKIYQMSTKYTKWPYNIPNGHIIYQMAI
jgi:hypothetical protein